MYIHTEFFSLGLLPQPTLISGSHIVQFKMIFEFSLFLLFFFSSPQCHGKINQLFINRHFIW